MKNTLDLAVIAMVIMMVVVMNTTSANFFLAVAGLAIVGIMAMFLAVE